MHQVRIPEALGSVLLQPATHDDLPVILRLLERCDLPIDDVPPIVEDFIAARSGDAVIGTVALESFASVGLLRSLAVDADSRKHGLGRSLCEYVLQEARRRAIGSVYLLTTDAVGYFAKLGFHEVDRALAPDAIRETQQFRELCPDSATLMCRHIRQP
ncbi:MAG: GNAT family N-acetyltransferase [Gemmatimonadota bacterium]|nr:MAG: GNAT family N-acetyltransferase [Gemmatimonadota bacterium]